MKGIQNVLCIGDVVNRSNRTVPDSELLVQHAYDRGNTIGGARCRGHQLVSPGIIKMVINTHNDIEHVLLDRG